MIVVMTIFTSFVFGLFLFQYLLPQFGYVLESRGQFVVAGYYCFLKEVGKVLLIEGFVFVAFGYYIDPFAKFMAEMFG